MKYYDMFIYFIIFIKVIFIFSKIGTKYYDHKLKNAKDEKEKSNMRETLEKLKYWEERAEFIFIACMSILLIYIFNPRWTVHPRINHETRLLFYLYGCIIILTADWGLFFKETKWFSYIQGILGRSQHKNTNTNINTENSMEKINYDLNTNNPFSSYYTNDELAYPENNFILSSQQPQVQTQQQQKAQTKTQNTSEKSAL